MKIKHKNKFLAIIVSIVAIFIPSLFLNKWLEGIIFYICHWVIREQFPKQYHHIIPATCRLITSTVLFFGVTFVSPISISLISAIPINYFIGWVGFTKYQCDYYERKASENKRRTFNVDTCTESELIQRCKDLHLSEENTNLAIEFFIRKTKQSVIADKLCINEKSVQIRKKRLKQKLNNS